MRPTRRVSAIQRSGNPERQFRKPNSKELDLLLLAGCSCLLTILYHPVAEALQVSSVNGTGTAIATQTTKIPSNSMNSFHLPLPPVRDEITEEEET